MMHAADECKAMAEPAPEIVPIEELKPAAVIPKPTLAPAGGKLIFSDSPEKFSEAGAFYRDVAEGEFRVFWHHINTSERTMTVAVAITNESDEAVELFSKGSGVETNIYEEVAGQLAMKEFMRTLGTARRLAVLQPGEHYFFESPTLPEHTTNGIAQLEALSQNSGKPAAVTVTVLGYERKPDHPQRIGILPMTQPTVRGTFSHCDRIGTLHYDPAAGNACRAIGSPATGRWKDDMPAEYEEGWSAVDNIPVINKGNYGVLYRWTVEIAGSRQAPHQVKVWLNPSGGYGQFTLQWDNKIYNSGHLDYTKAWNFATVNVGADGGTFDMLTSLTGGSFGPQTLYFTSER